MGVGRGVMGQPCRGDRPRSPAERYRTSHPVLTEHHRQSTPPREGIKVKGTAPAGRRRWHAAKRHTVQELPPSAYAATSLGEGGFGVAEPVGTTVPGRPYKRHRLYKIPLCGGVDCHKMIVGNKLYIWWQDGVVAVVEIHAEPPPPTATPPREGNKVKGVPHISVTPHPQHKIQWENAGMRSLMLSALTNMDKTKTRIGIVGGGQLGKMMILEAKRLGMHVATLDPSPDCPSASISDVMIVGELDDPAGYAALAQVSDVITYEFERINAAALDELERAGKAVYPSIASLKVIQSKYTQNQAYKSAGIPTPDFVLVASTEEIRALAADFGYPMMLKATRGGYDGKGNALIRDEAGVDAAFASLGGGQIELMVERCVDFVCEVSVIATRGINGKRVIYPIAENGHRDSILDVTIVPARIDRATAEKAVDIAERVMEVFDGVGTFGVEMFVTADGEVLVNEVAPRPHNSGHYTIEGCYCNQFENHVRAIVGLPLGDTTLRQPTAMLNLLGEGGGTATLVGLDQAYADPQVKVHLYGKSESKKARKMGHATIIGKSTEELMDKVEGLRGILRI